MSCVRSTRTRCVMCDSPQASEQREVSSTCVVGSCGAAECREAAGGLPRQPVHHIESQRVHDRRAGRSDDASGALPKDQSCVVVKDDLFSL